MAAQAATHDSRPHNEGRSSRSGKPYIESKHVLSGVVGGRLRGHDVIGGFCASDDAQTLFTGTLYAHMVAAKSPTPPMLR